MIKSVPKYFRLNDQTPDFDKLKNVLSSMPNVKQLFSNKKELKLDDELNSEQIELFKWIIPNNKRIKKVSVNTIQTNKYVKPDHVFEIIGKTIFTTVLIFKKKKIQNLNLL